LSFYENGTIALKGSKKHGFRSTSSKSPWPSCGVRPRGSHSEALSSLEIVVMDMVGEWRSDTFDALD
jgi:hypothetical protein